MVGPLNSNFSVFTVMLVGVRKFLRAYQTVKSLGYNLLKL